MIDGKKEKKGYGYRWMSETVFSCFKNMFGEFIRARAIKNMTKEIGLKVSIFNMMMNI
ncbi:MAG: hypothetical protein MASP_00926 [Candidatus Methanolliviera sp. GoM_asphalt]|nr:MAG: hypothetical protein MASP_00926 [Candidatus Methanolliviera sp. GoM_asphalt]